MKKTFTLKANPLFGSYNQERRRLEDKLQLALQRLFKEMLITILPEGTTEANINEDVAVNRLRKFGAQTRDLMLHHLEESALLGRDVAHSQVDKLMGVKAVAVPSEADWD